MAELILTDEEKALPFWNDLDDEALGKAVKRWGVWLSSQRLSDNTDDNEEGAMDLSLKAATVGMACRAHEMNVGEWDDDSRRRNDCWREHWQLGNSYPQNGLTGGEFCNQLQTDFCLKRSLW